MQGFKLKMNKLRITNIIMTGKLPIVNRLNFKNIIQNSKYVWFIPTPETCTQVCSTKFLREDGVNVAKHRKCVYISLWASGSINLVGLKSFKEGYKYYDLILKELKRIGEI